MSKHCDPRSIVLSLELMKKQVLFSIISCVIIICCLALFKYLQIAKAIEDSKKFAPPPDAVTSVKVTVQHWAKEISAAASLTSPQGTVLSIENAGTVSKILFESGQNIESGQVLVELDTSVEEAELKAAQAKLDWAKRNLKRAQTLREKNANSQADLEDAALKAREEEANVESLKAVLAKKRIVAPFSGRTGIRAVNIGQYVSAGTQIVPLYSVDPLYVNFSLPESAFNKVKVGQQVDVVTESISTEKFAGFVSAINPQLDEVTRNIEVQATISNKDNKLLPGMFARVTVGSEEKERVFSLPVSSINYAPYGDTVYVVEKVNGHDGAAYTGVRQQIVKLGRKKGNQVAVLSGLKEGEEVVTSGVFKLRPNAPVNVNNSIQLKDDLDPQPMNS